MASRVSLHAQLSSIMESMARSTLEQICKLVDKDSTELQLELSRLLRVNSALKERVESLECELTSVTSDAPELRKRFRSVGVQTLHCSDEDEDDHGSQAPTIECVFGNEWCMNFWKDRDPCSAEKHANSPLDPPVKSATLSAHVTVTELTEDLQEDVASVGQQKTPQHHVEHGEIVAGEQEPLSVNYDDGSTCSLSFHKDGAQLVAAGGLEDPSVHLMRMSDPQDGFSTHIIPIEDDDDDDEDDDVQFVEESQQESREATAAECSHGNQQTLRAGDAETPSSLDEHSQVELYIENEQPSPKERFPCHICNRVFFYKSTLTRHMKTHRANYCSICKQHFPRKYKINSHRCIPSTAAEARKKSCEQCGKTFHTQSALNIHNLVHTGEKPHLCNLCGKRFTQKGNLTCHLRLHTGERPYCCSKCGRTFSQKANLKQHSKWHTTGELVCQ